MSLSYLDLVLSKDFATSTLPSLVCNLSAIAWMVDSYEVIDQPSKPTKSTGTPKSSPPSKRRNQLQSFALTMIYMLGGGTLSSLLLLRSAGWCGDDSIIVSLAIAWLAMRSSLIRSISRSIWIYFPSLLLSHFFRAHLIISSLHTSSSVLPSHAMLGPLLITLIASRGSGWLTQLILFASGDNDTIASSDWAGNIPAGLKNVFFSIASYFFIMDIPGIIGAPLVSYAVANSAIIIIMTLDGVLNEYLNFNINFFAPLDYIVAALFKALAWSPIKLNENENIKMIDSNDISNIKKETDYFIKKIIKKNS